MKTSYRFIYIGITFTTYLLLCFIEFYILTHLLDMISTNYILHTIASIVCLVVINPIITYIIIEKIPLKPKLRAKKPINRES